MSVPVSILMVDDSPKLLELFVPQLQHCPGLTAQGCLCVDQSLIQLSDYIYQQDPDWVLMDYYVSSHFSGDDVVRELGQRNFRGKIIGFSSEPARERSFIVVGAFAFVHKNIDQVDEVISQILDCIL